ncbi:hypothetical protein SAMN05444695_104301 [Rhodococcus triatomae]|uniref:Uncharacterized protein n=2 Tax=Rhodococcus triatomae TaxID=300028 RepID=A0A1G8H3L7_9NOCA|nr:hypothetical protein SAMN05444695_104301 [Rhodococcus triatomae]
MLAATIEHGNRLVYKFRSRSAADILNDSVMAAVDGNVDGNRKAIELIGRALIDAASGDNDAELDDVCHVAFWYLGLMTPAAGGLLVDPPYDVPDLRRDTAAADDPIGLTAAAWHALRMRSVSHPFGCSLVLFALAWHGSLGAEAITTATGLPEDEATTHIDTLLSENLINVHTVDPVGVVFAAHLDAAPAELRNRVASNSAVLEWAWTLDRIDGRPMHRFTAVLLALFRDPDATHTVIELADARRDLAASGVNQPALAIALAWLDGRGCLTGYELAHGHLNYALNITGSSAIRDITVHSGGVEPEPQPDELPDEIPTEREYRAAAEHRPAAPDLLAVVVDHHTPALDVFGADSDELRLFDVIVDRIVSPRGRVRRDGNGNLAQWATNSTLADLSGLPDRSIYPAASALEDVGVLAANWVWSIPADGSDPHPRRVWSLVVPPQLR